jgi:hypothetical protein
MNISQQFLRASRKAGIGQASFNSLRETGAYWIHKAGMWEYELGGYPVVKKWLAYRDNGRRPDTALTLDEAEHLRGMVQRLAALLTLHEQLSVLYEETIKDCFRNEELGVL